MDLGVRNHLAKWSFEKNLKCIPTIMMMSSKLCLASFRILSIAIICGSNSCISIQDFSSIIFCITTFLGYNQRSLRVKERPKCQKRFYKLFLYPFLPSREENLPPQFPCLGVTVKFNEVRIAKFSCSVLLTPPNGLISRSFSISLNYR